MRLSAQGCVADRIRMLTYYVYAPLLIRPAPCPEPVATIIERGSFWYALQCLFKIILIQGFAIVINATDVVGGRTCIKLFSVSAFCESLFNGEEKNRKKTGRVYQQKRADQVFTEKQEQNKAGE